MLTIDALLREVIAALSEGSGEDGLPDPAVRRRLRDGSGATWNGSHWIGCAGPRNCRWTYLNRSTTGCAPWRAYCWKTLLIRALRPS